MPNILKQEAIFRYVVRLEDTIYLEEEHVTNFAITEKHAIPVDNRKQFSAEQTCNMGLLSSAKILAAEGSNKAKPSAVFGLGTCRMLFPRIYSEYQK